MSSVLFLVVLFPVWMCPTLVKTDYKTVSAQNHVCVRVAVVYDVEMSFTLNPFNVHSDIL